MKAKMIGNWIVGALGAWCVATACGQATSTEDSQTHWLEECDESADCGDELACECGHCVEQCSQKDDCASVGTGNAECFASSEGSVQSLCGSDATTSLCFEPCSAGSCAEGFRCVEGACVPRRDTGAGGSPGDAGLPEGCFDPHHNLVQPTGQGCECNPEVDSDVCAVGEDGYFYALVCQDGHWLSVEDGPCMPQGAASCDEDPDSCPSGQVCAPHFPYGDRRCKLLPDEATECVDHPSSECCTSDDCSEGACYPTFSYPSGPCGLGGADAVNGCFNDACSSDADCSDNEVCAAGDETQVLKTCLPAACRSDLDCAEEPNGACIWVTGGCCGTPGFQLACVYPDSWCRNDSDCPAAYPHCEVSDGTARCVAECIAPD
jgi:hypothetical protein